MIIQSTVAFSPNGRTLAVSGFNDRWKQIVRLVEIVEGQPRELFSLDANGVVAFSPDGSALATADDEGWVRTWDMISPMKPKTNQWKLPGRIREVAFAPDGRHLATANGNGTIYILRLEPPPAK